MPLITLDEAQKRLEPYKDDVFVAPWTTAFEQYGKFVKEQAALAKALDATARANIIHCWAREHARKALVGKAGIRETECMGFFAVLVDSDPVVRFKYLRDGRPSNVRTDQQQFLARQEYKKDVQLAFEEEGLSALPTTVTCGYELDVAQQLSQIVIRCDYKNDNLWTWPIWGDAAAGGGGIEPMPIPTLPTPTPRPAAVRSARESV
ncbi:MAG TPA: hypothetical protein VG650_04730 [Mycobacteriales bacterium]|nr:hypothetical protein [Mycobacteriales bacterium]